MVESRANLLLLLCAYVPPYVVTCSIFVSWQSFLLNVLTYLLTYISSTIGCANFGPNWPFFLKCTKFDQLIFRKIIKIVATRCQILTLKCTKIYLGWGSAPDPRWGSLQRSPGPLAGFKGAYF